MILKLAVAVAACRARLTFLTEISGWIFDERFVPPLGDAREIVLLTLSTTHAGLNNPSDLL
jgi:hypothetical protein